MNPTKNVLAALGVSAMTALTPAKAQLTPTSLFGTDHTTTTTPLYGAAQTSTSKLGTSTSGLFTYNNDLSSGSGAGIFNTGITDAGTWSDTHYLTVSSGGVDLMNISTGFSDGSMGLSGSGIEAISSAFEYNGIMNFAGIGNDDTVKFYEWGNSTAVATGPNVGSNYSGLEVITDGSASNLADLPILVSRNVESGAMLDQYFGGTIVGQYTDSRGDLISDISYNNSTGILTANHDLRGRAGAFSNYDFSEHVIPEPKDAGLLLGAGVLAAAAYRRRKE